VSLKEHPKVNEWLTCVEKEMRVTLASLLAEAMKDVSLFQSENIDSQKYLEWVDKYQVIQVAIFLQVAKCSVYYSSKNSKTLLSAPQLSQLLE
jgi:dynein heavy chain 1